MNLRPPKVTFYPVKDNAEKIQLICDRVNDAMQRKEKLIILVSGEQAARFIDDLLWRLPEESFIPHIRTNAATHERIVITELDRNLNEASLLLNLRTTVPSSYSEFEEIFEQYETSSPGKKQIAEDKIIEYRSKNVILEPIGNGVYSV